MSKQDRQGVRTPADIERKYNLSILSELQMGGVSGEELNKLNQTLAQFIAKTNADIEALREQIYPVGSIYVCYDNSEPSLLFGGEWELLAEGHLVVGLDQASEETQPELLQLNDTCYLWKRTK